MDVTKPIRRVVKVKNVGGDIRVINLKYERLPFFCFRCGLMDHMDRDCSLYDDDEQKYECGWGAWLRASPRKGLSKQKEEEDSIVARRRELFVVKPSGMGARRRGGDSEFVKEQCGVIKDGGGEYNGKVNAVRDGDGVDLAVADGHVGDGLVGTIRETGYQYKMRLPSDGEGEGDGPCSDAKVVEEVRGDGSGSDEVGEVAVVGELIGRMSTIGVERETNGSAKADELEQEVVGNGCHERNEEEVAPFQVGMSSGRIIKRKVGRKIKIRALPGGSLIKEGDGSQQDSQVGPGNTCLIGGSKRKDGPDLMDLDGADEVKRSRMGLDSELTLKVAELGWDPLREQQ